MQAYTSVCKTTDSMEPMQFAILNLNIMFSRWNELNLG